MKFKSVQDEQSFIHSMAMTILALDIACDSRHSTTMTPEFRQAACKERDRVVALHSDLVERQKARISLK